MSKAHTVLHEWFDREYSAREVYGRFWQRVKKHRMLLAMGILAGMLVGGTWLPIFQLVQPAMRMLQGEQVVETSATASEVKAATPGWFRVHVAQPVIGFLQGPDTASEDATQPPGWFRTHIAQPIAKLLQGEKSDVDSEGKPKDKTPGWLRSAQKIGDFFGIKTLDEGGCLTRQFFLLMAAIVPLFLVLRLLAIYANNYILQWVGLRAIQTLRNDMFQHLQNQSLGFFGRMDVGRISTRCMSDPGMLQGLITGTLSEMFTAPFEIAIALGFVIYFAIQNDMLSIIFIAVLGYPLVMLPLMRVAKKLRSYALEALQRSAVLGSNMLENLTCIRVVKAYHTEAFEVEKFKTTNNFCVNIILRSVRLSLLVTPFMEMITITLTIIFMAICVWQRITLDAIVPLVLPLVVAYKPLKKLGRVQIAIETGRAALNRVFSFLDTDTSLPVAANPVSKTTFDNNLAFVGVDFYYPNNNRQIVRAANFTLGRGKTIAVVGATGSGKTTLANILARFYDPTAGHVTMDGVDLRDIEIGHLRKLIGVVTQETILFNTTIAENIAYGTENVTQEQIEAAAKMANAHDFIMRDVHGYQRIVGDKGFVLSGGERQRVAIARAILKNPPILILDEATSALDTVTEQQVQEALTRLMENRTVFVIAHRLSTVRHADTILVMEQGDIIERGTHNELYARGGIYRNLCDVQMNRESGA